MVILTSIKNTNLRAQWKNGGFQQFLTYLSYFNNEIKSILELFQNTASSTDQLSYFKSRLEESNLSMNDNSIDLGILVCLSDPISDYKLIEQYFKKLDTYPSPFLGLIVFLDIFLKQNSTFTPFSNSDWQFIIDIFKNIELVFNRADQLKNNNNQYCNCISNDSITALINNISKLSLENIINNLVKLSKAQKSGQFITTDSLNELNISMETTLKDLLNIDQMLSNYFKMLE